MARRVFLKAAWAAVALILMCIAVGARAQLQIPDAAAHKYSYSASDFGGVGLFQTRTARFWDDGQADVAFTRVFPYERYNLSLQALPWLEATFRYTSVLNRSFDGGSSVFSGSSFKDRAFDAKVLIHRETRLTPQVAIGLQDLLGTGLFSGEYIVASKRYFDFDFSFGVGWGYSAGTSDIRNPLISLSDSFRVRGNAASQGGTPVVTSWFSGPNIGYFGGVEYETPVKGVSLKLEYDPNNYRREPINNTLPSTSHFNFGVNYRPFPWVEFSAARERGDLWMFRISLRANFNDAGIPKVDPPPPQLKPREAVQQELGTLVRVDSQETLRATPPPTATVNDETRRLDLATDELSRQGIALRAVSYVNQVVELELFSARDSQLSSEALTLALSAFVEASFPDAESIAVSFVASDEESADELLVRAGDNAADPLSTDNRSAQRQRTHPVPTHKIASKIFEQLAEEGLPAEGFELKQNEAILYFVASKYRQVARSVGRAARVVANNIPDDVELITLVMTSSGMELSRLTILRSELEAAVAQSGSPEEIWVRANVQPPQRGMVPPDIIRNNERFPAFDFSIGPRLRQHIGSRDGFYLYQLWLAFSGSLQLTPGLSLSGTIGVDLTNNFDRLTVNPPPTSVPRVRSFIREYLQQGENNLVRLQANYLLSPMPDVHTRFSVGYFEDMFGGFGGEVLYRPFGSRFASGLDINYVRQRDFNQRLTFRDYSVATGHVNLYYEIPYNDLLAQANIGRFLAGDVGTRFQISRVFAGGVRVGAWATFTDIPFAVFGEGSFDKGFFIVVPFDLLSVRSTTRSGAFSFRPLTKDGGQMLGITPRLYDVTAGGNLKALATDWDRFLD